MAVYFFDSSGVVKRYVSETGAPWVLGLVGPASGSSICVARITGVEVASAIAWQTHSGSLDPVDAANAMSQFRLGLAREYRIIEITAALVAVAMNLAETHILRAYDAVQLAATVQLKSWCDPLGLALTLVSADAALNAAATTEGLTVDDPNTHP